MISREKEQGTKGSVTVTFSLVFLLLFSFILSFFEMAAYTARSSFHAAAARLSAENFFAGYVAPMYSEYHIFGREIPANERVLKRVEDEIATDVLLMTKKKEGQTSLLLRSGADFNVVSAEVMTENGGEGFYRQAVEAMRYRSVLEVAELVKQYLGLSGQMEAQLRLMAEEAEVAAAYAAVDRGILNLFEMIDGVRLSQYEVFLRGKASVFQSDYYVKYFCTDAKNAEYSFERAEVYRAFCDNYTNPFGRLALLGGKARWLSQKVEEREKEQNRCFLERTELLEAFRMNADRRAVLEEKKKELKASKTALEKEQKKLRKKSKKTAEDQKCIEELTGLIGQVTGQLQQAETEEAALVSEYERLTEIQQELNIREQELAKQESEQLKEFKELKEEEARFLAESREVRRCCSLALSQVETVKQELKNAKLVKEGCEALLSQLQPVLGEESVKEFSEELGKYQLYESAEGYDFDRMKQTLEKNGALLDRLSVCLNGADSASLKQATDRFEKERTELGEYSWEGLRLSYGEISLAGSIKEQAVGVLENALSNSFLSLLTEEEPAEGQLELSYLPSGFHYAGQDTPGVLSLLGRELSDVFGTLAASFQGEAEIAQAVGAVTDPILFQAYLMTHFQDFSEPREDTVLRYELEYLIEGKAGDRENLSGVVMKICMLRAAGHLVSLYTDKERKAPVQAAALAACGAIGLPALKEVLVFLFLFLWAVEEALVDASALLYGKKLSLFPGRKDGSISFPELVCFSGQLVRTKAKAKRDPVGAGFGYRDFLQLYLLMTPKEYKCFRAMDLIQENLRSWYKTSFRLRQCVWRIDYQTDNRSYQYSYCD